jgi:hypothetical protein
VFTSSILSYTSPSQASTTAPLSASSSHYVLHLINEETRERFSGIDAMQQCFKCSISLFPLYFLLKVLACMYQYSYAYLSY